MNVDKQQVRFGESAERGRLGCCSARPSVVSPHTTVGPGARDLSRRNTGVADRRLKIPRILRFPSLLRTEVRAPFARATTTLNRCARPRGEQRHVRTRRMVNWVACAEWAARARLTAPEAGALYGSQDGWYLVSVVELLALQRYLFSAPPTNFGIVPSVAAGSAHFWSAAGSEAPRRFGLGARARPESGVNTAARRKTAGEPRALPQNSCLIEESTFPHSRPRRPAK